MPAPELWDLDDPSDARDWPGDSHASRSRCGSLKQLSTLLLTPGKALIGQFGGVKRMFTSSTGSTFTS